MNTRRFFLGAASGAIVTLTLAAGPFPSGVTRGIAPAVVKGNTVSINKATSTQPGYMTTAQVIALANAGSGGTVSDPLRVAHWASTTGEETIGGPINIVTSGTSGVVAKLTPSGPTATFGDPFSQRPNGALLGQSIPIGGGVWSGKSGGASETDTNNFSITSGYASANPPTAGGVGSLLIGNSANADGCISVRYLAYNSAAYSGPVFRSNAAGTNFWNLQIGSGHWYLAHYDASTPWSATVVSDTPESMTSGDTVSACFSGTSIKSYHNGVLVASVTSAVYQANTYSGLIDFSDDAGGNHFQDLFQNTTETPGLVLVVLNGGTFTMHKVAVDTINGQKPMTGIRFSALAETWSTPPTIAGQGTDADAGISIPGAVPSTDGCVLINAAVTNVYAYSCRVYTNDLAIVTSTCLAAGGCAGVPQQSTFSGYVVRQ